ncbi:MAG TPA: TraB/GumN family protein [Spongiibacteraceae bacterium]
MHLSIRSQFLIVTVFSALFSSFVFCAVANDCPPVPQPPTAETIEQLKANAHDHGFLWKMEKSGHTSWLYGTLHVGKLEWAMPGPLIGNALRASDTVAMELNLADSATIQKLDIFSRQGAGKIPEALRPRIQKQLDAMCLPASMLDAVNPMLLFESIEIMAARREGLEFAYGVETILTGYAQAANKPIVALETAESQIDALLGPQGGPTPAEMDETLQQIEQGSSVAVIQRLAQAWSQGDIDELERYASWCQCMETPSERAEMKRIADDRNGPLADSIDALHRRGKSVFVAVGALHMVGNSGIPEQLKRKGYTVTPIEFK